MYVRGAVNRQVFLPAGNWVNYWTGEKLAGNRTHIVVAPIQQIPLVVKEGSIIPYRNYASSIEKGNNKELFLDIYSDKTGSFTLVEDDGLSNEYLEGKYTATRIELKK